jgi:predicted nucleic acid-binding protein
VRDQPAQADAALRTIDELGERGHRMIVPIAIVAEVVYVVMRTYRVPKGRVAPRLRAALDAHEVVTDEPEIWEDLLTLWGWRGLSFVDAYLAARARRSGAAVLTFDAALASTPGLVALRPR